MTLSTIIRQYRADKSITMQQFAEKSGLSKGYISMLEKGTQPRNGKKITPSIETIAKIASAMNLTPDELVAMLDSNQRIYIGAKDEPPALAEPSAASFSLTPPEQGLITDYRAMNEEGQDKLTGYASDLVASGRYIKSNQPPVLEEEA